MPSKKRKNYKRVIREDGIKIPNFVEEWRRFREIPSQLQLAKMAGLPSQTVNRLEAHTLAWTWASLEKLAKVLDCREGDLIIINPFTQKASEELLKKLDKLSPEKRNRHNAYLDRLVASE